MLSFDAEELDAIKGQTVRFFFADDSFHHEKKDLVSALKQRADAVSEQLGVTITVESVALGSWDDFASLQRRRNEFDVLVVPSDSQISWWIEEGISDLLFPDLTGNTIADCDFTRFEGLFSLSVLDCAEAVDQKLTPFVSGTLDQNRKNATGVCFVNTDLFEKYAAEIRELSSSGGFGTLEEIVRNGYWTMDLLLDLSEFFKKNGEEADLLLPCDGDAYGVRQTDLFFAGSGKKTAEVQSFSPVTKNGFPVLQAVYKSLMGYEENEELYEKYLRIMDPEEPAAKDRETVYERFVSGKSFLVLEALSAADALYGNNTAILPLPLYDHAQFDADDPSLGYRSTVLKDEYFPLYSVVLTGDRDRLKAVTAVLAELVYEEPFGSSEKHLTDLDLFGVSLSSRGVFEDVVRQWNYEAYFAFYGGLAFGRVHDKNHLRHLIDNLNAALERKLDVFSGMIALSTAWRTRSD